VITDHYIMILDTIVAHKKLEVEIQKKEFSLDEIKRVIGNAGKVRGFKNALSIPGKVNLIAEIKKASPSRGIIREDFDPETIARLYQDNGAAAISVLTDEKFFQGSLSYLSKVRSKTSTTPILRKDFIIDEYQIYQSRLAGADAILLIAAILEFPELKRFLEISYSIDLECLVEVHTKDELNMVLKTDAPIIGINNRDLKTFNTDIQTTISLTKLIPKDRLIVSESGISTIDHIQLLRDCGVSAFLIGESLMKSEDIGHKMHQLMSL
jgi:indole-3-glycerol phosphate synthase